MRRESIDAAIRISKYPHAKTEGIRVDYIYPPIPVRAFDWCAYRDSVGPEGIVGWGASSAEAIQELLELEDEGETFGNPPCKVCGRTDVDLHTNMVCGECFLDKSDTV